jgi:ABC-type amino acid transport substrate-binding protein
MRAVGLGYGAILLMGWLGLPLAAAVGSDEADGQAAPARTERLRVAAVPLAAALEWDGSQPTGVMVDIWQELAGRLGVATDFVRVDTLVQLIDSIRGGGPADVALGPMAITEARERVIDLTHPIFHSGLRIAVRQRTSTGFTAALESLLSWRLVELFATVVGLAVASGHLLWWFERRVNPRSFPPSYPRGVWEAVWWIASVIVTGGCDDKHVDSTLGRAIAFAWMIGGIVLLAAFTSVLTATMTAERVTGTIHGPRDLAGRAVGCQEAAVTVPSVRQRGGVVQEFSTIHDALDALALGVVEAVVAENQQLMHLANQKGRESIRLVGPVFDSFDYGLGLPAGSTLREPINAAILQMRENGVLDRITQEWLGKHD